MPEPASASRGPSRFLLSLLRTHPGWTAWTLVASLLAAAFESAGVGLLVPVLQGIVGTDVSSSVPVVGPFIDDVGSTPTQRLGVACSIVLACVLLRCTFGYLASLAGDHLTQAVLHDVRVRLFRQLTEVGVGYFTGTRGGSIVNTMTSELTRLELALAAVTQALLHAALVVAYAVLLLAISPQLAVAAMGLSAAIFVVLSRQVRSLRRAGETASRSTETAVATLTERLAGARTIRAFATEARERAEFEDLSGQVRHWRSRELTGSALITPLAQALLSAAILSLVFVGYAFFVSRGRLSGPTLLAFFFGLFRLAPAVQLLVHNRATYTANRVGLVSVSEILRTDDKPYIRSGIQATRSLVSGIELHDVHFAYGTDRPVLHGVSLVVAKGRTTALVGPTGSGKSTVADLLVRFHDPTSGRLTWDGTDYRELELKSLRRRFGVVSQDTFVFHDTVRANVAYPVATATDDDVWRALREAGAAEFVAALPRRLDTVVGERGVQLSGGERQRLAIARALIADPDVLLLDEATSALDSLTERAVQEALERLMVGRTVVVIAHRLSTIRRADVVVVVDGGRVIEQGSYDDLVARGGGFARLHAVVYHDEPLRPTQAGLADG